MHRTLKAALKCSPETPWTRALPTVLLGLRTTFKEDLQASPAEMVFGSSLRIPGDFISPQDAPISSPVEFVSDLRRLFKAIRPVPAARHSNHHHPFVFKDLRSCDYVFRRVDAVRKPLEPPYTGPHRVIKRIDDRSYVVDVNGTAKTFSTDHLKPAYLASADELQQQLAMPPRPAPPMPAPFSPASPTPTPPAATSEPPLLRSALSHRRSPNIIAPKKRVTFSCPSQSAKSIGEGVAVAPPLLPSAPSIRGRKQLITPRDVFVCQPPAVTCRS